MILNCIIINNDKRIIELLTKYVENTPFLRLSGSYESAINAIKDIRENKIDLVFLATKMHELNGIEFARILTKDTKIVFIADDDSYAIDGYKVNAIDYLLNPVSYEDFLTASNNAHEYYTNANLYTKNNRFIFVKSEYKLVRIMLDEILFIEGEKDYVKFHLEKDNTITSLLNMKKIEGYLPKPEFLRPHRSYIVHMSKICLVDRFRIVFGKDFIPISDSYKNEIQDYFDAYKLS